MSSNLVSLRERIGDKPVTLIAVSKYANQDQMIEAFRQGVTQFGESRVQDAVLKQEELSSAFGNKVCWHFIGHLQSNKVKKVIGNFDLIHSVDSLDLAQVISREASKAGITQKILLQIKIVPDDSKSGFSILNVKECFGQLLALPNLKIEGLMTITPLTADATVRRNCFEGLRKLRDELRQMHGIDLNELSMGMSDDWEEAILAGSTMIRLGKAIFDQ